MNISWIKFNKEIVKTKTFWGAITGIVGAAGAYATGEIDAVKTVAAIAYCLFQMFQRDGVLKS